MTFRLREIRKRAGVTREQLAGLVGVMPADIERWESARKKSPRFHKAADIAVALGCTLDELAGIEARSEG